MTVINVCTKIGAKSGTSYPCQAWGTLDVAPNSSLNAISTNVLTLQNTDAAYQNRILKLESAAFAAAPSGGGNWLPPLSQSEANALSFAIISVFASVWIGRRVLGLIR